MDIKNFLIIDLSGLLEDIVITKLQQDVNKVIHRPSNKLEILSDEELIEYLKHHDFKDYIMKLTKISGVMEMEDGEVRILSRGAKIYKL